MSRLTDLREDTDPGLEHVGRKGIVKAGRHSQREVGDGLCRQPFQVLIRPRWPVARPMSVLRESRGADQQSPVPPMGPVKGHGPAKHESWANVQCQPFADKCLEV